MGLFSKKSKPKPAIETLGLRIEFDPDNEVWQFSDNGIDFVFYGPACVAPSRDQLTDIHADLTRLRPEMMRKLAEGWKQWPGVKMNDGETLLVNLTNLHSESSFEVCWSGGASWGDMGIDFTIKNHAITDESWGD